MATPKKKTPRRRQAETTWQPDYLYHEGRFKSGWTLAADGGGVITRVGPAQKGVKAVRLANRALLPGLVNAHSHAFQRVIRGRTEARAHAQDSFWTWREQMYHAAASLSPEDVYTASRMAFLEMVLSGITTVGEFHYLHHAPDGQPYADPNELAKRVIAAAQDTGLRICLLRVAYARAGHNVAPHPRQARFIEKKPETYLKHTEKLKAELPDARRPTPDAWLGVAPHSVRAVPLDYLKEVSAWAGKSRLPVHAHVAEQPAEIAVCVDEYGRGPVQLLATEGILSERFTGVHGIHVNSREIKALAESGATMCVCPTTERNLGDGIAPVDKYLAAGASLALGTDSHAQIDLLEDARELEYHLRLQNYERAVLARPEDGDPSALAALLFACATANGARSLGFDGGELAAGRPADFFTVDLNDPCIAGAAPDTLLANIVFTLNRAAAREVFVSGRAIVNEGRHTRQDETVSQFARLQERLWHQ
jgi:formimidoylglutamate deiminase